MRFKSKIDWWIYVLILGWIGANIWFIISYLANREFWVLIMVVIFTPVTVFVFIPMWRHTYYELGEEELLIKGGLGKGTSIRYDRMVSVTRTKNPISAPALSMDRVEIRFAFKSGTVFDTAIISPLERDEFFRLLMEKNPDIELLPGMQPMDKSTKLLAYVSIGIMAVTLVGVALMFVAGELEPGVSISDDSLRITGMYGIRVNYSEITSVTLIDQSMDEIYGGGGVSRTNGYGGPGQTAKGHFSSSALGSHRLYAQTKTSPTIHIQRNAADIFISFRDSERTQQLYRELVTALS